MPAYDSLRAEEETSIAVFTVLPEKSEVPLLLADTLGPAADRMNEGTFLWVLPNPPTVEKGSWGPGPLTMSPWLLRSALVDRWPRVRPED